MKNEDVRYFKLNNGDEIITEVVSYPSKDTPYCCINALKIHKIRSESEESSIYLLKPWMIGLVGPDKVVMIRELAITGESRPNSDLMEYYSKSVESYIARESEGDSDVPQSIDFDVPSVIH